MHTLISPFKAAKSFNVEHRLVSSMYIEAEELLNACCKSLMYNRNRISPRHDHWDTPILIVTILKPSSLPLQNCLLLLRYDLNLVRDRLNP